MRDPDGPAGGDPQRPPAWPTARPCPPATGWSHAELRRLVSGAGVGGGVRAAEAAVDPAELAAAHARYAAERDAALPPGHAGPRPSGGVGGTRKGVKCLHAHYAWHLAGGDDPVGRWVADRLAERRPATGRHVTGRGAIDCGTNSTRLLVGRRRRHHPRAAHAHHPPGPGRRRHRPPGAGGDRADGGRPRRVPGRPRPPRRRRGCGWRPRRPPATRPTATTSSTAAEAVVGVRPELLGGDEEARLSFLRRHRRARPGRRPVPRRRHRRRLDRVRGRAPTAARGRGVGRHRLRAHHREVPALRPARARGAHQRPHRRPRLPRRRGPRRPRGGRGRAASSAWPAR